MILKVNREEYESHVVLVLYKCVLVIEWIDLLQVLVALLGWVI